MGAKKKGRRNSETSQTPARGPHYRLTELACATPPLHTPQGSRPTQTLRPKSSSQADVSQHSLGPHPAVPYTRSDHSGSWGFNLQLIPLTGSAGSSCCLKQSLCPCCLQTPYKSDDRKCLFGKVPPACPMLVRGHRWERGREPPAAAVVHPSTRLVHTARPHSSTEHLRSRALSFP